MNAMKMDAKRSICSVKNDNNNSSSSVYFNFFIVGYD